MPNRVATWIFGLGAIVAGVIAVSVMVCSDLERRSPAPGAPAAGCSGWTAYALPALRLVDVAARARDDVWLLTEKGVYVYDGCTWRAHRPFANFAGGIIEWETIVVDPDGAIVVTGESPAGPTEVKRGCTEHSACCAVGPSFPARRRSYRFGGDRWQPIAARPRATPKVEVAASALGAERTIIATTDRDELLVIAKRVRNVGFPDPDGQIRGWGTVTSYELWRRRMGAWSIVLEPKVQDDLRRDVVAALPASERADRKREAELRSADVLAVSGQHAAHQPQSSRSWASSPTDVYVAHGKLRHFDGREWRDVAIDEPVVNAVWGTARDDVWVGGSSGVWHFDGQSWRRARGDAWINGIGGSGPHDVWAVGHRQETAMPEVLHFDGDTWRSHDGHLPRDQQYRLTGVTSTGRHAWVVGEHGTLLHWNGVWWIEQAAPTFGALDAVAVAAGVLWVAGDGVFRRD